MDATGKLKILLVEDHRLNRELLVDLLLDQGWSVHAVADARSAFELARSESWDGIIMDLALPGLDGLSAVRMLKQDERTRHIPVVAMTAHAMDEDASRSLDAGCCAHLTKPVDTRELPRQLLQAFATDSGGERE